MTGISLASPLAEQIGVLAALACGVAMGLWFDLIAPRRGLVLPLGALGLGLGAACGQAWAGIALGCLLAARVMAGPQPAA